MKDESLWPRLAGLRLVIEACEYERLHAVFAYEFERVTTQVRFVGAGTTRPSLPLEGRVDANELL